MDKTYKDFVRAQMRLNPCLYGLAEFMTKDRPKLQPDGIFSCLEYLKNNTRRLWTRLTPYDFVSTIRTAHQSPDEVLGRVLFVQDPGPETIDCLGSAFDIDPLFFATYIDTSFADLELRPAPPSIAIVPSRFSAKDAVHLHYQRILNLGDCARISEEKLKLDSNVARSVKRIPLLGGANLAFVRSCCSVLKKPVNGRQWLCLVLLDSTTAEIIQFDGSTKETRRYAQVPFQGGFEDIMDPISFSQFISTGASIAWRPRSLTQAVIRYFAKDMPGFDSTDPSMLSLSYYPIKVTISEWMIYTLLLSRYVKHYEYRLYRLDVQLRPDDLHELQPWRRRSKQSLHKLRLMQSFVERHISTEIEKGPWTDVLHDIQHLSSQVAQWASFLESLSSVATTMIQLTDTRRSVQEADNVKRLTAIALIFVPLGFVASLFSMSETVAPWSDRFWLYFAVAVPLLLVVLVFSVYPLGRVQR